MWRSGGAEVVSLGPGHASVRSWHLGSALKVVERAAWPPRERGPRWEDSQCHPHKIEEALTSFTLNSSLIFSVSLSFPPTELLLDVSSPRSWKRVRPPASAGSEREPRAARVHVQVQLWTDTGKSPNVPYAQISYL